MRRTTRAVYISKQILEIIDTTKLTLATPAAGSFAPPNIWDEWDM